LLDAGSGKDDILIVQFLIENGSDLTIEDNNKCTPLDIAARYGHVQYFDMVFD
jgi:ankyrin repeat protein